MNVEQTAREFLEISSEQRLNILLRLSKQQSKISTLAKELDATMPEVFRNFERMMKAGLIKKETDNTYSLTTYGRIVCQQVPSIHFASKNKKYFMTHDFGDLPQKFILRLSELNEQNHVKGFVKVLEKWKKVHLNAEKYIHNLMSEVPYSGDIIDCISNKLKNNVKIKSIISQNAIIPDERAELFEKKNFQKFVKSGILERRMKKTVSVVTLLNEKEACVIFPKINEGPDMSEMFYSSDNSFHEWCSDYFEDCWKNSTAFAEAKLSV